VLGRIQRGGSPTASDRVLAGRLGVYAIDLIAKGIDNVCVGLVDGRLRHHAIAEVTKSTNPNLDELLNVIDKLK
jgi:6-phosphofructokinase 1